MSKRAFAVMSSSGRSPSARVDIIRRLNPITIRGRRTRLRGTISRGYTRRSGYYGRFSGSGGGTGSDREGELKFFDTTAAVTGISGAGSLITSLNLIPQDTTESGRIGRKCTIKSLQWRYNLQIPEVDAEMTPQESGRIRLIMYQDKQTNGLAATAIQILNTADVNSFYNLEEQGRFRILMDKTVAMNPTTGFSDGTGLSSASAVNKYATFGKKVTIPLEFSNTDGALTGIRSNNTGILAISGGTAVIDLAGRVRVRYSDGG